MKKTLSYIAALALAAGLSAGFSACDDTMVDPSIQDYEESMTPTMVANTSILELKETFYQAGSGTSYNNYATRIGYRDNGEPYIIEGVITTNIASGNIYNQVFMQDEESGICFSISSKYLDSKGYKTGQRVVVKVTGLYIGAYGDGFQIGAVPTNGNAYPSRMTEDQWIAATEKDGLPHPDEAKPFEVTVEELRAASEKGSEAWFMMQGRLITVPDVKFRSPGAPLGEAGVSNNTQNLVDEAGNILALNTSGYSTIYSYLSPEGFGSVTGIITWYGNAWQLKLVSLDGLQGFTPFQQPEPLPAVPDGEGTLESPYSPAQVNALAASGQTANVYVEGYVVGDPAIEVKYGNAEYYISADGTYANRLYIYRGYGLNGAKFTATDQLKAGQKVVIKGDMTTYNSKPQIGTGSQIVSITDVE